MPSDKGWPIPKKDNTDVFLISQLGIAHNPHIICGATFWIDPQWKMEK